MSIPHTPTKNGTKKKSPIHYGSDSALYVLESQESVVDHSITKRCKRRLNDPSNTADITLSDLMTRMDEIKKQQDAKFASLESSIIALSTQNDEIKDSMIHLSAKYDDVLSNIETLQKENCFFKTHVKTLEAKLEQFEKNARSTTVELRNVPVSESEDKAKLVELAKNMGTVISVPIQDSDIRDVFRMKQKDRETSPIVLDFTSTIKKENFIRATRTYNKENSVHRLSTASLRINGPVKPVYVAESLTAAARRLHYLARVFAKDYHYEHCWTSFGKVYLKRKSNEPRVCITCEEDIGKLKRSI